MTTLAPELAKVYVLRSEGSVVYVACRNVTRVKPTSYFRDPPQARTLSALEALEVIKSLKADVSAEMQVEFLGEKP